MANFLLLSTVIAASFTTSKIYELCNSAILDSGSTIHIFNDITRFFNWIEADEEDYVFAGDSQVQILGYGDVDIIVKTSEGIRRVVRLREVAYCEGFACNIVSLRKLHRLGWRWDTGKGLVINTFGKEVCAVSDRADQFVLEYISPNTKKYAMNAMKTTTARLRRPAVTGTPNLWHLRLGHPGPEAIANLPANVLGAKMINAGPARNQRSPTTVECEGCAKGKMERQVDRAPRPRPDYPAERWAIDYFSLNEDDLGRNTLVVYTCRHSGYIYTNVLDSHEDSALKRSLDDFLVWLLNQHKTRPKVLETDNELARSIKIKRYLSRLGIVIEPSSPNTPAQNGGAERSGGVIMSRARAMRAHAKLPKFLHFETLGAAVYLNNRTPKQSLGWRTPYEVFHTYFYRRQGLKITDKKPYTGHLKAYGCKVCALTSIAQKRLDRKDKLENRAWLGYLVGYDSTNIYRIWIPFMGHVISVPHNEDPETVEKFGKVIRTRDVIFAENEFFDGNINSFKDDLKDINEAELYELITQVRMDPSEAEVLQPPRDAEEEEVYAPRRSVWQRMLDIEEIQRESQEDVYGSAEDIPGRERLSPPEEEVPGFERMLSQPEQAIGQEDQTDHLGPTELLTPRSVPLSPDVTMVAAMASLKISPEDNKAPQRPSVSREIPHRGGPWEAAFLAGKLAGRSTLKKITRSCFQIDRKWHRKDLPPPPKTYRDFLNHPHRDLFKKAMDSHMESHRQMRSWEQRHRSAADGQQTLDCMWVWVYKFNKHGVFQKAKARLVVRGDQQYGNILEDTYASTLAGRSFRTLIAVAARFDLEIIQYDVVNAFVHASLPYDVFMRLPPGYRHGTNKDTVLLLKKALYGLRESPILWQKYLTKALNRHGFVPVPEEPCCFVKAGVLFFFYVDDIAIAYHKTNRKVVDDLVNGLKQDFALQGGGDLQWFLGIEIIRDRQQRLIWLSQSEYIGKMAKLLTVRHRRQPSTPMTTKELLPSSNHAEYTKIYNYQRKVGSVMYAAVITRPYIAFAVSRLARFNSNPDDEQQRAVDQVIEYLLGTQYFALRIGGGDDLTIWTDASFADNSMDRKSSQGYAIKLFGGLIGWRANKQDTVTTSTTEAELLALTQGAKEALFTNRLIKSLGVSLDQPTPVPIWCDNQQTIRLVTAETAQLSTKLRHVDIHHHWVREKVQEGGLQVNYCPTKQMVADGLTKALPREAFLQFRNALGLDNLEKRQLQRRKEEEDVEDLFKGGEIEVSTEETTIEKEGITTENDVKLASQVQENGLG